MDIVVAFDGTLISIHALHEESDVRLQDYLAAGRWISIHALHEESDSSVVFFGLNLSTFQSTLSMRRATEHLRQRVPALGISIHALHEESDPVGACNYLR